MKNFKIYIWAVGWATTFVTRGLRIITDNWAEKELKTKEGKGVDLK